nr:MAG TPA: hypothetical protein [Caudoviricetes sp.]
MFHNFHKTFTREQLSLKKSLSGIYRKFYGTKLYILNANMHSISNQKKEKKVQLFFKKVLTFPVNGDTITVEINKKEKSAILDIITI